MTIKAASTVKPALFTVMPARRNSDPGYVRKLAEKTGHTHAELARALCIDPRTFRRYLQNDLTTDGHTPIPFAAQLVLELLAAGKARIA